MLFTSRVFVFFLAIVLVLYVALRRHLRWQNRMLLVAGLVFYGYWDWRFLALLMASMAMDYSFGNAIAASTDPTRRRWMLRASVAANLGVLGFFKYFEFFQAGFIQLLSGLGIEASPLVVGIILPVGISFYTFQSMSYTIDIYRGELRPVDRFEDFALYVSFFPQLVAGPIERASALIPQLMAPRRVTPEMFHTGVYLMLLGFFKKSFVADNLAPISDRIFNTWWEHDGLDLALGTLAFAFQIYGDFSGYTDIARGVARILGFELMINFRIPYLARSPSEFWARWHISLSTWLRDYLYIPLGGNRGGRRATYRNLMLTMVLGGLWHGAAWNFVLWGAYHGTLLVAYRRLGERVAWPAWFARGWRLAVRCYVEVAVMFGLTMVGWILFRSASVDQIAYILSHVSLAPQAMSGRIGYAIALFVVPLLAVEWHQCRTGDLLAVTKLPIPLRVLVYGAMAVIVIVFGRHKVEFVYFQF